MEQTLTGGTRLQGRPAAKEAGLPTISVITVVYNGQALIGKTIRSVLSQSYPNIEYIVIDGGSSDGTVQILRDNDNRISYWISERDKGIYDAMNKGLAAATGDYVWFMNAGDLIYSDDTAARIFTPELVGPAGNSSSLPAVLYGDTMIVDAEYREVGLRRLRPPERLTWKSFRRGMLVCHQALIVRRDIAEPYDPQYRHSADFDWTVRALKKAEGQEGRRAGGKGSRLKAQGTGGGDSLVARPSPHHLIISSSHRLISSPIINTHLVLCSFLDGGHSKQNIGISLKERFHSMVRHYGWLPTVIRHIPIAFRFFWYYLINKRF